MQVCNFNQEWDIFHVSCIVFYLLYGLLCVFAYKPYSRHIYFRNRWFNIHDNDKILSYYAISTGQNRLVICILTVFCYYSLNPTITYSNEMLQFSEYYMIFQISCWSMWLTTDIYYTVKLIKWPVIGTLHIILSSIVLYHSVLTYKAISYTEC